MSNTSELSLKGIMDSAQAVGKGLYVYLLKFTAEYCQHVRCANLSSFIVPADIANIQFSYEMDRLEMLYYRDNYVNKSA